MKRRRIRWIAGGVAALVVAALAGLYAYVSFRSTVLVNRLLSNAAEGMPDAAMSVDSTRVNLAGGIFHADGFRLTRAVNAMPEIFYAGQIDVEAAWMASLRNRRLVIREAEIADARLRVERYPDGSWNILTALISPDDAPDPGPADLPVADAPTWPVPPEAEIELPPPRDPPPRDPPPVVATPVPVKPLPPIQVDRLRIALLVEFQDALAGTGPLELEYSLTLAAEDVRTVGRAADSWANVRLTGHIADDPARGRLELTGRLAPFSDPARMSFDLQGSLTNVDSELLRQISGWDVQLDDSVIDVAVVSRDGVFDEQQSKFTVRARSLRLGTGFPRPMEGMRVSRIAVPVPLSGTLDDPRIAWDHALAEAIRHAGVAALTKGLENLFQ